MYFNIKGKSKPREVRVIDGGSREDIPNYKGGKTTEQREMIGRKNSSYGTENVLRGKFDKAIKENPGMKSSIAGEFRKY